MKVLVTGASGFLAQNLIPYLRSLSYDVYGTSRKWDVGEGIVKCHLNDYRQVKKAFTDILPKYIIHLSSNSAGKPPETNRWQLFEDNLMSTMNILEWCRELQYFPYIIFASSTVIYQPLLSTFGPNESSPIAPKSLYGVTKASCEMLIHSYHVESGGCFPYTHLRLPALVGPGLTHGVVKIFLDRLLSGEEFSALGQKPGAIKPYIHSDDVCNMIDKLMSNYKNNHNYLWKLNLSNNPISIEEVAKLIMGELGKEEEIKWINKNWPTDNNYLAAKNDDKYFNQIGFKKKYNSEEAIIQTVKDNT